MAGIIGSSAQIPNPGLKPLNVLIGVWKTEGSHGKLAGVTLHGSASFEWIENGAFLMMRSEITDNPRFPSGLAIFGSDDVQNRLSMLYFDERSVSRIQEVSVEGKVVKWWRDQPGFSQRCTSTVSRDGKTMVSKGEICKDGKNWEKDLELTYTKVE